MDKRKTIKWILISVAIAVGIYLLVCNCLTLANLVHMVRQNKSARDVALGEERYAQLIEEGVMVEYDLYTEEEIQANSNLSMAKLYYFPAPSGDKTKYVMVVPGGGYFECDTGKVAFPCAATLNQLGYSAFVLAYRYGKYSSKYAPIEDLSRAIRYVTDHAEQFNVDPEDYLCIGFSAGGNLVGNFATKDLGYQKYGVCKPKAVALIYPWSNINGDIPITGNVMQELVGGVGQLIGNKYLLGKGATKEEKQGVCIQNHMDADYPPTYILHGDNDFVVPHGYNSEVLVEALKANGVRYQYHLCEGLNHGFGLGVGTKAEGWLIEAVTFWQS